MTPPPSTLTDALTHRTNKQAVVDWVFDRVADRYDLGNDLMSLGWHTRLKRQLVRYAGIVEGHRVLDLACGTGDVTWMVAEVAGPRGLVVGTDVNLRMVRHAPRKARPDTRVRFALHDASALPFPDHSFDRVTCGFAGRGLPDLERTAAEVYRVLKPGGRFVNLDFARQDNPLWSATVMAYMRVSGAILGTALHRQPLTYVYIPESLRHYRGQAWFADVLGDAGFHTQLVETIGQLMAFHIADKPA